MPARSLVGACGWTAGSARGRCPRYANDERRRNKPEVQFQFGCLWACGPLRLPPRYAHEARRRRGGEVKTRARARVSATHERRLSLPCMSETPRPLRPCCSEFHERRAAIRRACSSPLLSVLANSRATRASANGGSRCLHAEFGVCLGGLRVGLGLNSRRAAIYLGGEGKVSIAVPSTQFPCLRLASAPCFQSANSDERPKRPTEDGGETQVRLVLVVCGEVRETPAAKPGPQPVELKPPLLPSGLRRRTPGPFPFNRTGTPKGPLGGLGLGRAATPGPGPG